MTLATLLNSDDAHAVSPQALNDAEIYVFVRIGGQHGSPRPFGKLLLELVGKFLVRLDVCADRIFKALSGEALSGVRSCFLFLLAYRGQPPCGHPICLYRKQDLTPRPHNYVADLLVRFVRCDVLYRVRDLAGRRLEEVARMLMEVEERIGEARREVHRHVGDFTLFWTGLYPEALRHLRSSHRADFFVDYCRQGKRSYYIASTIPAEDDEENAVLRRLSDDFEMCVYGLGEVRREFDAVLGDGKRRR